MNILYYHCFAGISGDMNLAAMIDLGVPPELLKNEIAKLNVGGYKIEIKETIKSGITGTQVTVVLDQTEHQGNKHKHKHGHRSYKAIKNIFADADLSNEVKKTSLNIFEKIAAAEAKIHGKNIDDVHFHEVGAVDSIVDIVGAAICYHYLAPEKTLCSTVELGGGFVNCAHGKFPVPAPATAEILKSVPVKLGTVNFETTTPTGAAILATLVDEFTDTPNFLIEKTSYGIGHRDLEIPNVLRVHLAKSIHGNYMKETAILLECNIDDMPAEHFEFLSERLLSAGASDVYLTPIIMKKSRPATMLSVLCSQSKSNKLTDVILQESTSLGVRQKEISKIMLERKVVNTDTKYGSIDVKVAYSADHPIKF
jgi:uncharacterized protein (TIGR00299 family) protein